MVPLPFLLRPASIDTALLAAKVRAIEAGVPQARLGVAIKDLRTGEVWLYRGDERFPLQSVFKLPLGVALLRAVDRGEIKLDDTVRLTTKDLSVPMSAINGEVGRGAKTYSLRTLLRMAAGVSDNTAADFLMLRLGGPRRVTAELVRVGVRGLRIDRYERDLQREATGLGPFVPAMTTEEGFVAALGALPRAARVGAMRRYLADPRDTATPRGMLGFIEGFDAGQFLMPSTQKVLNEIATQTTTGRNRLKAGLPAGTVLTHKTGTGREIEGRAGAVNDVGIARLPDGRKLAIVVFLAGAGGTSARRERALAEVARAAVEATASRPRRSKLRSERS